MIFSISACTSSKKTALVIAGSEINSEIFTYYFDKVARRPVDYSLPEHADTDELKEAAINECKRYLVANTSFENRGLSLTASQKVEISQTVNDYWLRFENHYNETGVSKQTLTKIFTADTYREVLFTTEYDKGINNTATEEIIQEYFYESYISFRNVCIYYTSADGSPMTQLEKNQLLESVNALASTAGKDAEAFAQTVQDAGYTLSSSVLLKIGSDTYPDGFYESVAEQKNGTVQVITYDECVFIVWKENLRDKGESVYANYRSACIRDVYQPMALKKTESYLETLEVEEKGIVNRIINKLT